MVDILLILEMEDYLVKSRNILIKAELLLEEIKKYEGVNEALRVLAEDEMEQGWVALRQ